MRRSKVDNEKQGALSASGYQIDFEHWYRVLGLKEDKTDPELKRKQEFLKFLKGLSEHEAHMFWQEKLMEIEEKYTLDNLEKAAHNKWKQIKSTWRNTGVPDKVLFFAVVDKEQEKLLSSNNY
jgi:hypothetical protein